MNPEFIEALGDMTIKVGRELGIPVLAGLAAVWIVVEFLRTLRAKWGQGGSG